MQQEKKRANDLQKGNNLNESWHPNIPIKSRNRDVLPSKGREEIIVHVEICSQQKTFSWKGWSKNS